MRNVIWLQSTIFYTNKIMSMLRDSFLVSCWGGWVTLFILRAVKAGDSRRSLTFSTVKNSKIRHHYSHCGIRICSPPHASCSDFHLARSLCGQVGRGPSPEGGEHWRSLHPKCQIPARFMSQGVTYFQSHSLCNRGCQTYL